MGEDLSSEHNLKPSKPLFTPLVCELNKLSIVAVLNSLGSYRRLGRCATGTLLAEDDVREEMTAAGEADIEVKENAFPVEEEEEEEEKDGLKVEVELTFFVSAEIIPPVGAEVEVRKGCVAEKKDVDNVFGSSCMGRFTDKLIVDIVLIGE